MGASQVQTSHVEGGKVSLDSPNLDGGTLK